MALKPGLRVSQTQKLSLTPSLRQSLEILGMSTTELQTVIAEALEQNPLLEIESDHRSTGQGSYQFATDTVAQNQSISDVLSQQIHLRNAPKPVRQLALYLAADLDEHGFIADSDQEIAAEHNIDRELVQLAITLLQECDPIGVGARSLKECLDLQLIAKGEDAQNRQVIVENLTDFANFDWGNLKRKSGMKLPELKRLSLILKSLNPFPLHTIAPAIAQTIRPDVQVNRLTEGGFAVELIRSVFPTLKVDQQLFDASVRDDPTSAEYLKTNMGQAQSLMRALKARSATVLRINHKIVEIQHQFFVDGPNLLRPMTQVDAAAILNIHPSTLTRSIANKYLTCDYGTFPLKFFFSHPINSLNADPASAVYVVQQELKRMVSVESNTKILSDERITAILRDSGVDIARRTVAKYRQCLNIPNSAQRRRSKNSL
ncbi:MAG: RNA polymerase sigma-54 factor [Paracoccaceae bacterium]